MVVKNDLVPVLNGLYTEYGQLIERISSIHAATTALHEVGKAYGLDLPQNPYASFVAPTAQPVRTPGELPPKLAATTPAPALAAHAAEVEPAYSAAPVAEKPVPAAPVQSTPITNNGKPGYIDTPKPPVKATVSHPPATAAPVRTQPVVGAKANLSLERTPVVHAGVKTATQVPPANARKVVSPTAQPEGEPPRPKGGWLTVEQFKEILSAWNPQINVGNLSLTDIYHGLRTRGCRYGSSLAPTMDLSDSDTVRILSNHLRHEWVPGYPQHCQTLQGFYAQGTLYKTIRDKAEAAVHFAFPEMAKAKMGRTPGSYSSGPSSRPLRTGANSPFAGLGQLVR